MISVVVFFAMMTADKVLDPCGSIKFEEIRAQQIAAKKTWKIPKGETATDISKPPERKREAALVEPPKVIYRIPKGEKSTDIDKKLITRKVLK